METFHDEVLQHLQQGRQLLQSQIDAVVELREKKERYTMASFLLLLADVKRHRCTVLYCPVREYQGN